MTTNLPSTDLLTRLRTRFAFFTGKGGVGKTSAACATSVALARSGKRVLLVSTDPASNLDDVLGTPLGAQARPITGVSGLEALNIDPEKAARAYRERVVGPYRGVLPQEAVASIEEQLSGACTTEIAAFDEFAALLAGEGRAADYDHIVFDTAPTGHTLRLLALPAAWTGFLEKSAQGASCLGPTAKVEIQRDRYTRAVAALSDPERTTLVLVTRPEASAIREAERARVQLSTHGMRNQLLVVNGVFHVHDPGDPLAVAIDEQMRAALVDLPPGLASLPRVEVPLRAYNVTGVPALQRFFDAESEDTATRAREDDPPLEGVVSLAQLVDEVAAAGHGLIMVMGKGGVGKTTLAASVAVDLASRGLTVHLTTTDPAAHLLETLAGDVENLRVSRIDPAAEVAAYTKAVVDRSRDTLDSAGLALLEEDLRSPCTEEVAVFHAFSRAIAHAGREVVVMDTAPTGHTLLLLDATGSYHKEILRQSRGHVVATPMMRLQDPKWTRILLVTLPETTPVHEASALQQDLRRAGIEPYGWIINRSLAAARPRDPLLVERARQERRHITEVVTRLARRTAIVPWLAEPPVGAARLGALARGEPSTIARVRYAVAGEPGTGPPLRPGALCGFRKLCPVDSGNSGRFTSAHFTR